MVSEVWDVPNSKHYYHSNTWLPPIWECVLWDVSVQQSLVGQHKQRTDSSFLIIRVLIWTPCSFKFICRATLLLLGPQNQTRALSGSYAYIVSALCATWAPSLADDWALGTGSEQQSRLPTSRPASKQVSLGPSSRAQNGLSQMKWLKPKPQSLHYACHAYESVIPD